MTEDTKVLLGMMRAQAWERAKGELQAVIAAYINDAARFERMDKLVMQFVMTVQDEGLAE